LTEFNDPEVKFELIRKILHFDYKGELFTKPMKSGKESFIRLVDLLLYDEKNYEKIQKYLFRGDIYTEPVISIILSNMTKEIYPEFIKFLFKLFENKKNILMQFVYLIRIYKPIESEEKFSFLVKFLHDVFDQNYKTTVECMKLNLIEFFSKSNFSFNSVLSGISVARILDILTIYGHYSRDSYKELFIHLKNKNIFLAIISELSKESCENFISLFKKISSRVKPIPYECLKCHGQALNFFKNREKMENLERFLEKIYDNNEHGKFVKRFLVYDNFVYLLGNAVQDKKMFQTLVKFINENNCSFEVLRNILVSNRTLMSTFIYTLEENYKRLAEFLGKIYEDNKEQIVPSIGQYLFFVGNEFYDLEKKEKFPIFEQFLIDICGSDNKNIVDKCMTKIFRYIYDNKKMGEGSEGNKKCDCIKKYETRKEEIINEVFEVFICQEHEPIVGMFYYENFIAIKFLTDLSKNFKNHWDWAQDLFLDDFPFESIQRMSIETYDALENFLKLVFKTNKKKLSEEIQKKYSNDEIMDNENENCKKFVVAFMK